MSVPIPTVDLLKRIEKDSNKVFVLGTKVSASIESLEEWLNRLSGRIEHECWGDTDREGLTFGVAIRRIGKAWRLCSSYAPAFSENPSITWEVLTDQPLRVKLAAVEMFPKLLGELAARQEELANSLTAAAAT